MSFVAKQRKHGIKTNLARCLQMVAMVTGMCRSVPKRIYFINHNIKKLFCKTNLLFLKNVKVTGTFSVKEKQNTKLWHQKWGRVMNWPLDYRWKVYEF